MRKIRVRCLCIVCMGELFWRMGKLCRHKLFFVFLNSSPFFMVCRDRCRTLGEVITPARPQARTSAKGGSCFAVVVRRYIAVKQLNQNSAECRKVILALGNPLWGLRNWVPRQHPLTRERSWYLSTPFLGLWEKCWIFPIRKVFCVNSHELPLCTSESLSHTHIHTHSVGLWV